MQPSAALFIIVGGFMWCGGITSVACIFIYYPEILLHGNPIGMRCVLACTGAILGIPIGLFAHQIYSRFTSKIYPDLLLNAWIGFIIPLFISNLFLGCYILLQQVVDFLPDYLSRIWGIVHISILIWLISTITKDPSQVISNWSPSLDATINTVKEILTPATRRVLDLRFLVRHQIMALAYTGFLEGSWILPRATLDQLRIWSLTKSDRLQHRSQRTLASINLLETSCPKKLFVSLRKYPNNWGPIRAMLADSQRSRTRLLLTSYYPQQEFWQESSLLLPNWSQALQSPYQPGDWLELPIVGAGKLADQGQSHLEDGSLVFITQGALYVGQKVRVEIAQILHSVTGFVIFAHLAPTHRQRLNSSI